MREFNIIDKEKWVFIKEVANRAIFSKKRNITRVRFLKIFDLFETIKTKIRKKKLFECIFFIFGLVTKDRVLYKDKSRLKKLWEFKYLFNSNIILKIFIKKIFDNFN
jgi:hypothetical protein